MTPKVRDLDTLTAGDRFITQDTQRVGTLAFCSPSSATVEWDNTKQKKEGQTRWGKTFTFTSGDKREAISLKTRVIKLVRRTKR